jgi:dephospho-CoA kinase
MIKIGLCGSSGSGKGYVSKKFKAYGVEYIDTDKVYRDIAVDGSDCVNELCSYFGEGILSEDGTLDRKELSKRVFEEDNASAHLKVLNEITHKYIRYETVRILEENESKGVIATIIDAPVLFESGFDKMCDVTVCVTAPTELKINRILKRDNIPIEKAEARLQSQLSDGSLRERCDYEIVNDDSGSLEYEIERVARSLGIVK